MVESIKELWKICYSDPAIVRPWPNMYLSKVSIYLTWVLLHTKITPNQITFFYIFLLILSSVFLFTGNLGYISLGISLIFIANFLDIVDGEIARYRKITSLTGVYLEKIFHDLVFPFMFFPLAFGIFLQTGWTSILVFGFICSVFSRSLVVSSIYSAIIGSLVINDAAVRNFKVRNHHEKVSSNLHENGFGKKLHSLYDKFNAFWKYPTNVIQLMVISLIEIVNLFYNFFTSYSIFYWYIVIYAVLSFFSQLASLIIHYRSKTVEHLYKDLLGKN